MKYSDRLIYNLSIYSPKINVIFKKYLMYRILISIINIFGINRIVINLLLKLGANPIVVAHMNDNTQILIDLRSGTEFNALQSGDYDDFLLGILKKILDPYKIFLDIGANIGFYSVAISAKIKNSNNQGRVIAFEPFGSNYDRLLDNLKLNNLESICSANNFGLSDSSTVSKITLREDFLNGSKTGNASISINDDFDSGFEQVQVELRRFDNFWDEVGFNFNNNIDLIKLDIEGHEDLCLKGFGDILNLHRPTILMEINKPYFSARQVNIDNMILPIIPSNYIILRNHSNKWIRITSFDYCKNFDNIFLIPIEKTELDSYRIFN